MVNNSQFNWGGGGVEAPQFTSEGGGWAQYLRKKENEKMKRRKYK